MSAAATQSAPSASRVTDSNQVTLGGVSWTTYECLADDLGENLTYLTYDHGTLHIMSPLNRHETYKKLIGRLIEGLAFELRLEICATGSTTLRRKDLQQGLEPDESFYIQNAARVRGRRQLHMGIDPPPDLVVEVDISRDSTTRMSIYASLGVPEIWRWADERVSFYCLNERAEYNEQQASRALPFVQPGDVTSAVHDAMKRGHTDAIRDFAARIHERIRDSASDRAKDA